MRIRLGAASAALIIAAAAFGNLEMAVAADPKPVVNEKFADLDPAIAELRAEVGKDRRDVVKANMLLTASEADRFWPLYDEYRAARDKVGDRKVKLISDFAASSNTISEDEAQRLSKEFFSIERAKLAVKEKYLAKMSKTLSARTVARFFQIDQKLDAIVDMGLAARVPLMH